MNSLGENYMTAQVCPPLCGPSTMEYRCKLPGCAEFDARDAAARAAYEDLVQRTPPDVGAALSNMRWLAFAVAAIFILLVWGSRR